MTAPATTTAIDPALRKILADDPGALVERVAKDHNTTVTTVVAALPEAMRKFAAGEHFVTVMGDVAQWGEVTVIVHTEDGIMEFTGPVPEGQIARGYYNLMSRTGFHGHLRYERCAAIAFVERPFMNRDSASILFLNKEGGCMLKVFVGRDENGALKADQLARFRDLAARIGAA